jgi:diketogulonate reductase-like aldo/keto reductase
MEQRPLGKTGRTVARIGQGTWRVKDRALASEGILEGLRLGMTHVDTAELYEWNSQSETMLGDVLSRQGPDGRPWRDSVFLASKVHPRNATAKRVPASCKDSLVRLQTDHLDLYYHHWREHDVPLSETLRAIAGLVDAGWVGAIGVSNYDVGDLEEAQSMLGRGRIAANQVLYHLEDRGAETDVIPWCRNHGITVVAYSPFGAGAFVRGRGLAALEEAARDAGCTPRQAALAFLTREAHVVAIPKAERVEHVRENAGGARDLPRDVVDRLDQAFPVQAGLRTI